MGERTRETQVGHGGSMNDPDDSNDDRVVDAVKDYMKLLDAGNAPSQEEYLMQHAEIADELRPSLEGLALVHQAGVNSIASSHQSVEIQAPDAEFAAKPIGDFRIVGEIGRGGMGVVYEAVQMSLNRHVALKVLPFASGLDEVRLQRFRNEANAAAALHHTNIVPVYAVGSDRGVHYYAMQMIDGNTLADLIASMAGTEQQQGSFDSTLLGTDHNQDDSPTPVRISSPTQETVSQNAALSSTVLTNSKTERSQHYRSVVGMIHQASLAIEHAHLYGVVHRDIKPANLLLDSAGKIWVADFGLAQVQSDQSNLTRTGDPMGTLRYMSPEQAAGRRDGIDHRTDIYSLGVTLYELLTLRPAIADGDYREMLNRVALVEPPSPKSIDPLLPIELDTIVRKAIAKLPAERYATAGEFAKDLQAWLDDKPIAAKPPTVLERLNKWRRRNSGLVAMAGLLLMVATAALTVTTFMTSAALTRETKQRAVAENRFKQALTAVETFSSLSESELSHRDNMQDLRRSFLQTSLTFYQDFLDEREDNDSVAADLQATRDHVQRMVEELTVLENLSPLNLLSQLRVQEELGATDDNAAEVRAAIDDFRRARDSLSNRFVGGLQDENNELSGLLMTLDESIHQHLSQEQLERLRQLNRQRRLPFTFKDSETIAALALTGKQVEEIDRIIEENAPRGPRGGGGPRGDRMRGDGPQGDRMRGDGPRGDGMRGDSPQGEGMRGEGPRGGPPGDGMRGDGMRDGPWRGGPDRQMGGRGPGGPPDDQNQSGLQETVERIVATLSPKQQTQWKALIGKPFQW